MKVKPFYVDITELPAIDIFELIYLMPFSYKDSNYWDSEHKMPYIGCANTYVFNSDSEQGPTFDKLSFDEAITRLRG